MFDDFSSFRGTRDPLDPSKIPLSKLDHSPGGGKADQISWDHIPARRGDDREFHGDAWAALQRIPQDHGKFSAISCYFSRKKIW